MKIQELPQDVQDIIEYTKLRREHPEINIQLRKEFGIKDNPTLKQMYRMLYILRDITPEGQKNEHSRTNKTTLQRETACKI